MPGQRHVLHHLTGHRRHAADGEQFGTPERHALPVGELPMRRHPARVARRAEAVDERGEHRRVQPAHTGCRALEPPADADGVEPVGNGAGHERPGQFGRRTGVGVEGDHPLADRGLDPLLQCPRLTRPPGGQRRTGDHPRPGRSGERSGAVAALVVDHHHLCHTGCRTKGVEHRADARRFVAGRHDDRDGGIGRATVDAGDRLQRRPPVGRPGNARQRHTPCHEAQHEPQPRACTAHAWSASTRSATMRAPMVTSGRPPPGWLLPPTR